MNFDVEVQGFEEAVSSIERMAKALEPKAVEPVFMEGAKTIASAAKVRATRGATGNLIRSIKTKFLRQLGNNPRSAMAAVDRKKAPHAHLIEYGTSARYQKTTGRYTGMGPARPFWRPAVDGNIDKIYHEIRDKLVDLVVEKFRGH